MTQVKLFMTKSNFDIRTLVNRMCNLTNDDFNGKNGDEFTSKRALNEGFNCDMSYTVDKLVTKYQYREPYTATLLNLVHDYCKALFKNTKYYTGDYTINYDILENKFVVSIAYITKD